VETRPPSPHAPSPPGARDPLAIRDDVGVGAVCAAAWNELAPGQPLLSHAFFDALHASGCAAPRTGWRPCFFTAWEGDRLVGALPLYDKAHSFGEYVFDWAWADAYRRHGLPYYPKLVAAIPFTPAPGPRLMAGAGAAAAPLLAAALRRLHAPEPRRPAPSSLHLLFITPHEARLCAEAGMLIRHGVQFHWSNPGYRDFGDYLGAFSHDRRKKIKQERRKLAAAGVEFERRSGAEITADDWAYFHRCYENTYRAHRSTPYLSLGFFRQIGATMPESLLLVVGRRRGFRVCAALYFHGGGTLWGRYWGATEAIAGLHFETCYYQAIEFCIARGIARFEGGAQGLHKLARGLLAVPTYSAHAVADPEFARAIELFCARERSEVARALDEFELAAPIRRPDGERATGATDAGRDPAAAPRDA